MLRKRIIETGLQDENYVKLLSKSFEFNLNTLKWEIILAIPLSYSIVTLISQGPSRNFIIRIDSLNPAVDKQSLRQLRTNGSLQEEKEFSFRNIFIGYDAVVYLNSAGLQGD